MTCYDELKLLRIKHGTSEFDFSVKKLMRERVNSDRGKKIGFSWTQINRAYKRQKGICPICTGEMSLDRYKVHGDHWDCNLTVEQGLNAETNCMATHKTCNLKKSSKTPAELSKLRQLNPLMGSEE